MTYITIMSPIVKTLFSGLSTRPINQKDKLES